MKVEMFAVYDRKAKGFNTPFFALNGGLACRYVSMREKAEASALTEYPEDFFVARLGEVDLESGAVIPLDGKYETVMEVKNLIMRGE